MKKKIPPKEQSRELNKARLEFLKRNKKQYEEFLSSVPNYDEGVEYCKRNNISQEALDDCLSELIGRSAVMSHWEPGSRAWRAALVRAGIQMGRNTGLLAIHKSEEERLNEYYLEELIKDAKKIIGYLMRERSSKMLLASIDLERSTETIMAEIKDEVLSAKREMSDSRLKWLPMADELLEVWDLYVDAGKQPSKETFRQISKKVNRPLSTVRDQWHDAYRRIFGEPYNPESKYATEEKRAEADQLCAKCPHGAKCYRGTDWIQCSDYTRISGKERKPKTVEYVDDIDYSDT